MTRYNRSPQELAGGGAAALAAQAPALAAASHPKVDGATAAALARLRIAADGLAFEHDTGGWRRWRRAARVGGAQSTCTFVAGGAQSLGVTWLASCGDFCRPWLNGERLSWRQRLLALTPPLPTIKKNKLLHWLYTLFTGLPGRAE